LKSYFPKHTAMSHGGMAEVGTD